MLAIRSYISGNITSLKLGTGPIPTKNTTLVLGNTTSIVSGVSNLTAGMGAGNSLTTGTNNTIIGASCGASLVTGNNNIIFGAASGNVAGSAYTSSESNNTCIGNTGIVGDANSVRIGNNTHTMCDIYPMLVMNKTVVSNPTSPLSAANLIGNAGGILVKTNTGALTLQLPTGTAITAALSGTAANVTTGSTFMVIVINASTFGAITFSINTNMAIADTTNTIAAHTRSALTFYCTGTNAWTMY